IGLDGEEADREGGHGQGNGHGQRDALAPGPDVAEILDRRGHRRSLTFRAYESAEADSGRETDCCDRNGRIDAGLVAAAMVARHPGSAGMRSTRSGSPGREHVMTPEQEREFIERQIDREISRRHVISWATKAGIGSAAAVSSS